MDQFITVANSIGQIISFTWWGKMSNKYCNTLMLVFAGLGMGMIPLLSLFSTNLYYLASCSSYQDCHYLGLIPCYSTIC